MSVKPVDPLDKLYEDMFVVLNTSDNQFINLVHDNVKDKKTTVTAVTALASSKEDTVMSKFAFLMKTWRATVNTILDAETKKTGDNIYEKHTLAVAIVINNGYPTTSIPSKPEEKQMNQARHILALGVMCELTHSITFFQTAKTEGDANMGRLEAVLNALKVEPR